MPSPERRLAAILFSDIVGYTALMARDEAAGLRARERHRSVLRAQARRYHGEIVDENGDELVLVFPSDLDSVNCALATQAALRDDPELALRIGIHAGDVIFEKGRVYGDGVNVASRVRPYAEPGGVCVSEPVYEAVKNQPNVEATSLGVQELKNVPRPVEVFALRGAPVEPAAARPGGWAGMRAAIALGAAAAIVLAALGWWALRGGSPKPVAGRKVPTSLVVLPFDDMSPDRDQAYFADGMTEALTNVLVGVPGLQVVGRTTAEVVKERRLAIGEIGSELGVGAVVEGSIRRSGDRLRITAQLVAVKDGFHLWSETYDRPLADIFAVQDDVARAVADALEARLAVGRKRPPTRSMQAYESWARGVRMSATGTEEGVRGGIEHLERAIALDPDFVWALSVLSTAYSNLWTLGYEHNEEKLQRAGELARRAVTLDDQNPWNHTALGWFHVASYEFGEAAQAFRRALELSPRNTDALMGLGILQVARGRVEEGLGLLDRAVALDPLSFFVVIGAGAGHWAVGDPGRAVSLLERAIQLVPTHPYAQLALARAYAGLGREDESLEALLGIGFPSEAEDAIRDAYHRDGVKGANGVFLELQRAHSGLECTLFPIVGAAIEVDRGHSAQALRCLESAVDQRTLHITAFLEVDPLWDPLRDDPRFQAILEGMGLAD